MQQTGVVAFQGELGAYSHQACKQAYPAHTVLPCESFQAAIAAVRDGAADLAMLPVENSTYGRVADIHQLLPESGLHIIAEAFVRVRIALLGLPGAVVNDIEQAYSHPVLLGQCREFLKAHSITGVVGVDTAGSARSIAEAGDKRVGALASTLAADIYGLDVIARDIEDRDHNTTRFLAMARDPSTPAADVEVMTSFVFQVKNIPAALYKALSGFATCGVNMVKLESYMIDGSFTATQFYAEIQGDQRDPNVEQAMRELGYFTKRVDVLGVYPAAKQR
ncbi:MAG: prephenate dehydratase [Pseudomonadota bacterium]